MSNSVQQSDGISDNEIIRRRLARLEMALRSVYGDIPGAAPWTPHGRVRAEIRGAVQYLQLAQRELELDK